MRAHRRGDAVTRVREYLAIEGLIEGPFVIRIECEQGAVEIQCDGLEDEEEEGKVSPVVPGGVRRFSPDEAKILAATHPADYRPSERIALLAGARHCEGFKKLLTNLVDLGALESLPGKGYRHAAGLSVG